MTAFDNATMITDDQPPEFTCSAVWGGKLSAREVFFSPVVWRGSAVWGSRTLFTNTVTALAVDGLSARVPGSKSRSAN